MHRILLFFLAFLGLAGLARPAGAQEGKLLGALSSDYYSPMRVLELQAGCHYTWMPKALKDSGIDPAKVRGLLEGTKIYLNHAGSCKEPMKTVLEQQAAQHTAEVRALRDSLTAVRKQIAVFTKESVARKTSLDSLQKELANAKADAINLLGLTGWVLLTAIAIFFASVGALLMHIRLTWGEPRSGHGKEGHITMDPPVRQDGTAEAKRRWQR